MEEYRPPVQNIHVTVDAVVFGYREDRLELLLVKRKFEPFSGKWALPGGFVQNGESPEKAISRELEEETGLHVHYLEQLFTFGNPDRDPRFQVVSVAYMILLRSDQTTLQASTDAAEACWVDVAVCPELAFDHGAILETALRRLRAKLRYEPVGFDLLPEKFLFSELERLYSAILQQPLDRRNFRKKVLSLGILEELPERVSEGPGRPANLYRFVSSRYEQLQSDNLPFQLVR